MRLPVGEGFIMSPTISQTFPQSRMTPSAFSCFAHTRLFSNSPLTTAGVPWRREGISVGRFPKWKWAKRSPGGLYVWQTKELRKRIFGSVASKGVRSEFSGSVANTGLSVKKKAFDCCPPTALETSACLNSRRLTSLCHDHRSSTTDHVPSPLCRFASAGIIC